ncbi:hypothetical protein DB32_004759 [Sandaracinus amylolyticus]|uniref:Uncharacterized protein n=1 Tax=Sandaracinus amylolyticus TaxID=927083 RepID=A0A0F6YJ53_9BACT|nr:hypothetical protein DB32_004759 [Sandaracinus amylolyticus]
MPSGETREQVGLGMHCASARDGPTETEPTTIALASAAVIIARAKN